MKCYIANKKLLILLLSILAFTKSSIISNEINSFLENENSSSTTTITELETDLVKLLSKIKQKKLEVKNQNKDLVPVKIRNFYDLKDYLEKIKKLRNHILSEKNEDNKILLELSEKVDKSIKENQNNLSNLKDKYDNIIKKINTLNQDLSSKGNENNQLKSLYRNNLIDFDNRFNKYFSNLNNIAKSLSSENNNNNNYSKIFSSLNNKIGNLKNELNNRNSLQEEILKQKEKLQKSEIELKKYKTIINESKLDHKLFSVVNSNLENNFDQIKSSYLNSTISVTSLKKVLNDKENINKLEIEKSQIDENNRDYMKNIKSLLESSEKIQSEVNDLIRKKSKLKEDLNLKEIESTHKIFNLKSEITKFNSEIKIVEDKMLKNVKEHKKFLLNNELKLKNLILILNNLLSKVNQNSKDDDRLLNNLLFDKNTLDITSGVNGELIDEINKSILK